MRFQIVRRITLANMLNNNKIVMRNNFVYTVVFVLASTVFFSCQKGKESSEDVNTQVSADSSSMSYTCPMHPEVVSHKLGKCPTCGMDLVAKKDNDEGKEHSDSTHQH
jgi:hypothetical protein